jgi:hypothetical protein
MSQPTDPAHRNLHVVFTIDSHGHITPSTPNQLHANVHDIVAIQAVSSPPVDPATEIDCLWNGESCCRVLFDVDYLKPGREYQLRQRGPAPYYVIASKAGAAGPKITMNGELHVGSPGDPQSGGSHGHKHHK